MALSTNVRKETVGSLEMNSHLEKYKDTDVESLKLIF